MSEPHGAHDAHRATADDRSDPLRRSLPWHSLAEAAVLAALDTRASGLSQREAQQRLQRLGPNVLPEPPARPAWRIFARQFASPLIYILFAAALLAAWLGHRSDAGVILVVVLANALIGAFQEGRAERSMAALRRLAELRARVLRDGQEAELPARDLVPGDVLLLAAGDAVGADARVLHAASLQTAEAALTGESVPVWKAPAPLPEATALADRRSLVHAGTYVSAGRGMAVVVATGAHTEVGRIAGMTEHAVEPATPLERRIAGFGRMLLVAAVVLFVAVVALGAWRQMPLVSVLMVAVSQMVSMVPEGLPVAMTIALAVGMQRMAERGAIVRRLSAVETLGSTTVICSDKTGTLTRNEMTATEVWLPDGRTISVNGAGYEPSGDLRDPQGHRVANDPALAPLLRVAVLCNDAALLPPEDERGQWAIVGDPTEAALLTLAAKAGMDVSGERGTTSRVAELPFDAESRLMAVEVQVHAQVQAHLETNGPRALPRVLLKGSPEAVLRLCAAADPDLAARARRAADAMSSRALRVLAFAQMHDGPLDTRAGFEALAGRVHLLGLVGEIDPPRPEAAVAVAACRDAGIRPVMLTGDHKLTGLAIARELGIAREGDRAVDGSELERMSEPELADALAGIAVFARVQPAQKLRIVQALQARGEVVAMTGDGVNDAPALALADVGVAMGRGGTEVARSASKIVLTDDDFATIVRAVEQGRVVYGNLKKLILFLFATSIDEVVVLLLALFAGYPLPLTAVQILWINIVTEGTLTVNLVMEPADGNEMRRPPLPRDDRLLDRAMLGRIALMAGTSAAIVFGWFAMRLSAGVDVATVRTEAFTLVAVCQWFNLLNCESATRSALRLGVLRNPWLVGGLGLSVLLQCVALYAPAMNAWFGTVPIPPLTLLALTAVASAVLWVEEARKFFVRIGRRARGRE